MAPAENTSTTICGQPASSQEIAWCAECFLTTLHMAAKLGIVPDTLRVLDVSRPLNRLLVTTSFLPNWEQILPIMAPGSTIHPLSVADGNFEFPNNLMIINGIRIQGSCVAARLTHERMLEFAALHQIRPVVQLFDMTEEGILDAMEKLDQGKVHFRAVLKPVA
ncbi:hypothetical protein EKO27_g497 [Xylaria grammica]|uniref:Alcohol dehydrogenase-like C-terminal domain-containing protein n=1 Tax=Xylaria grammica TaxID=363999 RepID=A0A439DJJ2_9PEZI|nr:hypothetical protein EKO27_g497 [Xylaria grammica]